MSDGCTRCRTPYGELSHPRFVGNTIATGLEVRRKTYRMDLERITEAGWATQRLPAAEGQAKGKLVVWITRVHCRCSWRGQVAGVHTELLEMLLPDPVAQAELRRRAVTQNRRPLVVVEV